MRMVLKGKWDKELQVVFEDTVCYRPNHIYSILILLGRQGPLFLLTSLMDAQRHIGFPLAFSLSELSHQHCLEATIMIYTRV